MIAEAPDKPSDVLASGASISWTNVPYARLYIIFRDNKVIGFTIDNKFTDANAVAGTAYTYAVQAVSEYGALSSITEATKSNRVTLSASVNNSAAGTITQTPESVDYAINSSVSVQATPSDKYHFVKWTDGANNLISADNPLTITMDANKTIIAVFEETRVTLTTSVNISGAGTITKTPESADYLINSSVSVQATASDKYHFVKWTDGANNLISKDNPLAVILDTNKTMIAVFEQIPTGIIDPDDKISVYARKNEVIIEGTRIGSVITVYSLSGILLHSKVTTSCKETFALQHGIFLIKISSGNSNRTLKIAVE